MKRICFVVNPIAGMGGKVGLKGTDGVVEEALEKGAQPRAPDRARTSISRLKEAFDRHRVKDRVEWFTAEGEMGGDILLDLKHDLWDVNIIHRPKKRSTSEDTSETIRKSLEENVELVLFCGGDGTARDVLSAVDETPMFGIPSGVKMHSGVFAIDPEIAGELMEFYLRGEMTTGEGDVMDLDEDRYRKGDWNIKLFGKANTLYEPSFVQTGKFVVQEEGMEKLVEEIADFIVEMMEDEPERLFILGPGGTMESIGERIGIDKTHLGVDAVRGKKQVGKDIDERRILELIPQNNNEKASIIVSPIGGQGFFLGRGNLQISPEVVKKIGPKNVIVVSVPQKLERTDRLRVDTGDHDLDREFRNMGSIKVLTGYRTYRLKKIG